MPLLDTGSIIIGLLFGSIGFGYFLYGKKQAHAVARYSGIALMIYPYFVQNKYAAVGVGIVLMLLPKFVQL